MREFFREWKRKIGVVTLVMACTLAVIWMRSLIVPDTIQITLFRCTLYGRSFEGITTWRYYAAEKPTRDIPNSVRCDSGKSSDFAESVERRMFERMAHLEEEAKKQLNSSDEREKQIGMRTLDVVAAARPHQWIIPYWFFVLAMTLLSAYLLLTKPRKPAAVPTDGVV